MVEFMECGERPHFGLKSSHRLSRRAMVGLRAAMAQILEVVLLWNMI